MKYYGLVIYPSYCITLIYFFLKDLNVRYKLYPNNHTKLMSVLVFLHCLSVIYTIQLNYYIYPDQQVREPVNIVHFVFTFFVGFSSVELITVLTGGVRDSLAPDVPIQKKRIRRAAPVAQPMENDSRIECKICLLEYNDNTRAPRILKECGHTVCHECAQNLLRKFNNIHLFCPYCQQLSVIKGPATTLAKNFLVTDFMWKLKNDYN
ncbi:hypothetical protein CAEBREN_19882 [Caenorhabditis brenneri]|uniref:RING-type domain-containing protein n=1 Tax=Caenorhabditis brenneri TaxID=135651 RepID=G0MWW5_CAEBE|nr:hypothetical protein CAEBREN_19882 [Caenorhabditis brenneri]